MPARTIAIGDVHGCSRALAALIATIDPDPDDLIIPLGDYIDRGPDSPGVLDQLIALRGRCRLAPLLGNHEQMLRDARGDYLTRVHWLASGGRATLAAYGGDLDLIPHEHIAFIESCAAYHETETHIFVHANYDPDLPMVEQPAQLLRWESLRASIPRPHASGKAVVVGHTSQKDGEVLDLGHLTCIDTYCCGGRWLTALDVSTGRIWQADDRGRLRD